jgi:hypothetical protein
VVCVRRSLTEGYNRSITQSRPLVVDQRLLQNWSGFSGPSSAANKYGPAEIRRWVRYAANRAQVGTHYFAEID